jgi:hypothetical protein
MSYEYVTHQEECEDTGLILKIIQDPDPFNPREDYCEASTLCCDHGRYDLGDKDGHEKARDAIRASRDYRESWEDYESDQYLDFSHGPDLYEAIQRCTDIVTLPLYLYDHSGITIRCAPFSCPWDSGQVGFAFMSKATILKEYGGKILTKAKREKAEGLIQAEVKTYDSYLTGDCWGFAIEDQDGETLDSCWGFLGDSDYCEQEAQDIYKGMIEQQKADNALLDKVGVPEVPA